MYVPSHIQRMLAADTMTTAERRAADEQLGKLAADMSRLRKRIAERARILARPLQVASRAVATFRKTARETRRGTTANCPQSPESLSRDLHVTQHPPRWERSGQGSL